MAAEKENVVLDPFTRKRNVIGFILFASLTLGYFHSQGAIDRSYLPMWFLIGIAYIVLYLLYRIANTLTKSDWNRREHWYPTDVFEPIVAQH